MLLWEGMACRERGRSWKKHSLVTDILGETVVEGCVVCIKLNGGELM